MREREKGRREGRREREDIPGGKGERKRREGKGRRMSGSGSSGCLKW